MTIASRDNNVSDRSIQLLDQLNSLQEILESGCPLEHLNLLTGKNKYSR